jgi:hypothetical protein
MGLWTLSIVRRVKYKNIKIEIHNVSQAGSISGTLNTDAG